MNDFQRHRSALARGDDTHMTEVDRSAKRELGAAYVEGSRADATVSGDSRESITVTQGGHMSPAGSHVSTDLAELGDQGILYQRYDIGVHTHNTLR